MDPKMSAKSKRSHHSHHAIKPSVAAPPATGGNVKKPSKPNSDKTRSLSQPLPSNWDRYEDKFDSDAGDSSSTVDKDRSRRSDDVVAPKSKGADFSYLISQAQTESYSRSNPNPNSESFASFDDVLPDFIQGVSSIISVRGKSLLSWCGNDNFIVDDNVTSNYEAPFLSMDLHALAAELAKVDVSQRLFIESDLFPTDLCPDASIENNSRGKVSSETSNAREAEHGLAPLEFHGAVAEKNVASKNDLMPSTATTSDSSQACGNYAMPRASDENSSLSLPRHDTKKDPANSSNLFDGTDRSEIQCLAKTSSSPSSDSKEEKTSRFETAAAEAELDMLLDSFGETKLLNSLSTDEKPGIGFQVAQHNSHVQILKGSSVYIGAKSLKQVLDTSKQASMNATLDDAIDDLLGETSTVSNTEPAAYSEQERSFPSNSTSCSGSKVLDDFDSWLDTL
ncbi:phosphorelay protein [Tasmannia lanceolata]|uniref:phosphorelay protein n=1 Tax=Tasmannia lanceolata TaxID=3420 RepID=UPI004063179F